MEPEKYKLEYLPSARQDMLESMRYINGELKNRKAALQLSQELIEAAEGLRQFPYRHAVYRSRRPLKQEFRRLRVKNYLIFYWVDEAERLVTIARVIYAKRNYEELL